jgi:hypothetical protein
MATPTPASQPPSAQATQQLVFVDLPTVSETFADHLKMVAFDGQSLRLEFGVTRMDEHRPPAPHTGRRYPCCRLVLTPAAAIELMNHMQRMATHLVQAGVLKAEPGAKVDGAKA